MLTPRLDQRRIRGNGKEGMTMSGMRTKMATALVLPLVAMGALGAPTVSAAPGRAADPTLPINYVVNASTHVAKLGLDVTVPPGSFVGSLDLATGALTGKLSLPPAQATFSLAGIGLVTAGFTIVPTRPLTGHVNLKKMKVKTTSVFNVLIPYVYPLGLPINLVGSSCGTSQTISLVIKGTINLTGPSTFRGTYTIPPLSNCGLTTVALNLVIPGPGNTFTATFSPAPS
jgi:hypothetical protein